MKCFCPSVCLSVCLPPFLCVYLSVSACLPAWCSLFITTRSIDIYLYICILKIIYASTIPACYQVCHIQTLSNLSFTNFGLLTTTISTGICVSHLNIYCLISEIYISVIGHRSIFSLPTCTKIAIKQKHHFVQLVTINYVWYVAYFTVKFMIWVWLSNTIE